MPTKTEKNPKQRATRPKRVTLRDIAEVAGVHVMTVSDALNDTRSVAPATRARIKEIAREMNYVPNFAARALVTGRSGMIAVISGAMNEPYYANMVHILEKHLMADEYQLLLLRTPREVQHLVNAAGAAAVDGAIAIDMHHLVEEFRDRSTVPCVSIGTRAHEFIDHVVIDLSEGVAQALQIMVQSGRERIAYVVTAAHMAWPREVRARVYFETMKNAGREPEVINVETDEFPVVRARLASYLRENGCPGALMCQNDETAMIAYRALCDCGFRVPQDAFLVGCDGQAHMEYFDPPLSTVVQPMEEVCATAWQLLQQRLAKPDLPLQSATHCGTLQVRASLTG